MQMFYSLLVRTLRKTIQLVLDGFQKHKKKAAKLITVDPRYTRTAQMSDYYGQLRSGTDIPFVGGMINYIFENNLIP